MVRRKQDRQQLRVGPSHEGGALGHEEELPVDSMPREQLGNQHSRQGRAERTESQRRGQRALAASYQIKDRKQQDDAVLPAHEGRKAGKRSHQRVATESLVLPRPQPDEGEQRHGEQRRAVGVGRRDRGVVHGRRGEPGDEGSPQGWSRTKQHTATR